MTFRKVKFRGSLVQAFWGLCLVVGSGLIGTSVLPAQEMAVATKYLTSDVFSAFVLHPQKLAADPKLDVFPREIVAAYGKRELGIDPMQATQLTYVGLISEDLLLTGNENVAVILYFDDPVKLTPLEDNWNAEEIEGHGGVKAYKKNDDFLFVCQADERTILLGTPLSVPGLLEPNANEKLIASLKKCADDSHIYGVGYYDKLAGLVKANAQEAFRQMPFPVPPPVVAGQSSGYGGIW